MAWEADLLGVGVLAEALVSVTKRLSSYSSDEEKEEALATLLDVVDQTTEALQEVDEEIAAGGIDVAEGERVRKRIHKVLASLVIPARKIAEAVGATGVSVTVGFPFTFEVTFDFPPAD
jgi:hypothetical protein